MLSVRKYKRFMRNNRRRSMGGVSLNLTWNKPGNTERRNKGAKFPREKRPKIVQ